MNDVHCRVLLVDNHPLFRRGVAQLIQAEPDFEVVGEAMSAEEGVLLAASLKPDLVLMDLNMPHHSGLDALKQIKESGLETQVIMLTVSDAEEDFIEAVRAGAEGYLLKDSEPEEILDKLRQAARGESVFTESLMNVLLDAGWRSGAAGKRAMPYRARAADLAVDRRRQEQQADCPRSEYQRRHRKGACEELVAKAEPPVAPRSGHMGFESFAPD